MVVGCVTAWLVTGPLRGGEAAATGSLQYTNNGQLKRPKDYREWIFLTSGLGMTYGPTAMQMPMGDPDFDNVFVNRAAFKSFQATGTWPDQTIFVLEVRASQSKGSINKAGHFQAEVTDIETHVKDEKRFPGKWAFFAFPNGADTGDLGRVGGWAGGGGL